MTTEDLGILVVLGLLAIAGAGILLRKLAPVAAKLIVFCIVVYVLGWIAKAVMAIGIAKSFFGLVAIAVVLYLIWSISLYLRGRK